MYKITYGSSRGKKIWLNSHKTIGDIKDSTGETIGHKYILSSVELNIIDNINKIVWTIENTGNKEIEITLPEEEQKEIIKSCYEFSKSKGYIDKIIKRYNNK